ncbi:MAG: hypothetical protein IPN18_05110 [Ignavibacteriales bacterium]|nr:hypothetical protein [Ignavibacteriales bacterium]
MKAENMAKLIFMQSRYKSRRQTVKEEMRRLIDELFATENLCLSTRQTGCPQNLPR